MLAISTSSILDSANLLLPRLVVVAHSFPTLAGETSMAFKTYQLYAGASASASGAATVTIRRDCEIVGIGYSVLLDQVADNSSARIAVSVNPTSQIGVNDGMGSLLEVGQYANLVTSGLSQNSLSGYAQIPPIALRTNDVLYLHAAIVTSTYYANFVIYVRER